MTNLQIMYIIFSGVGAFFLLISMFGGDVDGDIDIGDGDISDGDSGTESTSVFSIRTIATFLLGFGVAGWLAIRGGYGVTGQLISGFITGLIITSLYFLVMKFIYSMQGSSMVSSSNMIGKKGIINIPTTNTGIAQFKISTGSGFHEYSCKEENDIKLKQNDTIEIISDLGGGTLLVKKS